MVRSFVAACGLLVVLASPVWAETPAPAGPPAAAMSAEPGLADAGTAEREALAHRFFAAAHVDTTINMLLNSMMPVLLAQAESGNHKLTAEQRTTQADLATVVTRQALEDIMPEYLDASAKVYAKVFTLEELKTMVAFYESPVGQSVIRKNALVVGPVTQIMAGLMPKLKASLYRHICEHVGCKASDAIAPREH